MQVRRCQEGDPSALGQLRTQCHAGLRNILLARGANATEAEDVLADLWSDCVPGLDEQPSLLDKFSGRTTLSCWLATVATNRWLDAKRREARRFQVQPAEAGDLDQDVLLGEPMLGTAAREETLARLLKESLRAAFARACSQALVLLRLVYVHELTQREVGRMLGWSESKLSRFLSDTLRQIEVDTLRELRQRDRWLELTWQDFVDLCETHQIGFI